MITKLKRVVERTPDGLVTTREPKNVDSEVVETVEHKGFTVEVHMLTDEKSDYRFQPLILKDGKVVRRIFVRSKRAYVSLEHFAKRAIDHYIKNGEWPAKQGVMVSM